MAYALLIDDDLALLESVKRAVEAYGLEISTASTWEEGLARFQAMSPNLVIADYNLPGSRRGLSLLFEIANLQPSVRLVLFSAYLSDEDVAEVEGLPFIHRAFRKTDAVATARAILDEVRMAAEASKRPTDWAAYGQAAERTGAVSADALRKLDEYLSTNRLPKQGRDGDD
jgi:ActR/RegA family two-component response regulator